MRAPALLLVLCAACGPASISGEVGGASLDDGAAVARHAQVKLGLEWNSIDVTIGGGDTPNLCRDLSRKSLRADASYLQLTFGVQGPLVPGEFAIGNTPLLSERWAGAIANRMDAACGDTLRRAAQSGLITLDSVDAKTISGSFELKFDDGEVSGSFDAPVCDLVSVPIGSASDCRVGSD